MAGVVVVGVDGSEGSVAAVRWCVANAPKLGAHSSPPLEFLVTPPKRTVLPRSSSYAMAARKRACGPLLETSRQQSAPPHWPHAPSS